MDNYDLNRTDKCEMRLELTLKVSKLRNYDVLGKSDPFAVVYVNNSSDPRSHLVHYSSLQTRPIKHSQHLTAAKANSVGAASSSAAVSGGNSGASNPAIGKPSALYPNIPGHLRPQQSYPGHIAQQISTNVDKIVAPLPALPVPGRPKLAPRKKPWEQIGYTEVVKNTLEAAFATPIRCTYFFERPQQLAIDVYDEDARSRDLRAHDYLGSALFTIASLVRAEDKCLKLPLRMEGAPRRDCGFITIVAEDKALRRHLVTMDLGIEFRRNPVTLKSVFRAFAPFLLIQRRASSSNADWMTVYKSKKPARRDNRVHHSSPGLNTDSAATETTRNLQESKHSYVFEPIRVSHEQLGGDDARLKISLVTHGYREKEYATAYCTLKELREQRQLQLKGRHRKAELKMRNYSKVKESQFIDYVMGGCEMNIVVGIDFTASNGNPYQPTSLHFNNQYKANEYESAIRAVSEIIMEYDSRKEMLAFGFGARLPPNYDKVCHCFSLTGNQNPVCYDIDSLLDAYRQTLVQVNLSGPTEFSSLIEFAARSAQYQESKNPQAYTILLIVTDGVINDFDETIRAIVNASKLPLSIVIVGVGDADFTAMEFLDGDDIPISLGSARDIVQFVPYRRFHNSMDRLTSEVLDEIPNQLVTYYSQKNIPPNATRPHQGQGQGDPGEALNFPDLPYSRNDSTGYTVPPPPRPQSARLLRRHPPQDRHGGVSQDYMQPPPQGGFGHQEYYEGAPYGGGQMQPQTEREYNQDDRIPSGYNHRQTQGQFPPSNPHGVPPDGQSIEFPIAVDNFDSVQEGVTKT